MAPYCQDSSACAQEEDLGSDRIVPHGQEGELLRGYRQTQEALVP